MLTTLGAPASDGLGTNLADIALSTMGKGIVQSTVGSHADERLRGRTVCWYLAVLPPAITLIACLVGAIGPILHPGMKPLWSLPFWVGAGGSVFGIYMGIRFTSLQTLEDSATSLKRDVSRLESNLDLAQKQLEQSQTQIEELERTNAEFRENVLLLEETRRGHETTLRGYEASLGEFKEMSAQELADRRQQAVDMRLEIGKLDVQIQAFNKQIITNQAVADELGERVKEARQLLTEQHVHQARELGRFATENVRLERTVGSLIDALTPPSSPHKAEG